MEKMKPVDSGVVFAAIVIPCIQINNLVRRCVNECADKFPDAEIIVVVDTPDYSPDTTTKATVIVSGDETIAAKRNLAVRNTGASYIGFIDSDAYPEDGWLPNAIAALNGDRQIWAVGGPNVSPPEETPSERFVGLALRSWIVSGTNNYRKFKAPARFCDDLPSCNLVVRRDDYLDLGGMDEAIFTGEDIDFCFRLRKSGGKILYTPDVLVYHKNRPMSLFVNQRIVYGATSWRIMSRTKSFSKIYLFLPAAFVMFLATGPLIAVFEPWKALYTSLIALYSLLVLVETLRYSVRFTDVPGVAVALLIGNLAPALGTLGLPLKLLPNLKSIYRN